MEFPSILFFSISYIISSICCAIGLYILFSSVSDSGHPLSLVKYAIAYLTSLSVFASSTCAFLVRPALRSRTPHIPVDFEPILVEVKEVLVSKFFVHLLIVIVPLYFLSSILGANKFILIIPSILLFGICYILTYTTSNYSISHRMSNFSTSHRIYLDHTYCWGFLTAIFVDLAVTSLGYYLLSIVICYFLYMYVAYGLFATYMSFVRLYCTSPSLMWIYERREIIQFAIGMVGTILFQFFLRLTSTIQMVAFLCLAMAWLGNLSMVQPSSDLGIFNFLLVNACLSCAANLFKLRPYTWLVFVVCLLLYFLRCKLVTVELRYDELWFTRSQPLVLPQTAPLSPSPLSSSSSTEPDVVPPVIPQRMVSSSSLSSSSEVGVASALPQTLPLSPPSPSSTVDTVILPQTMPSLSSTYAIASTPIPSSPSSPPSSKTSGCPSPSTTSSTPAIITAL